MYDIYYYYNTIRKLHSFPSLSNAPALPNTHKQKKKLLEGIDDASTELMMGMGDNVSLMLGEAFLEVSEDAATEHCEAEVEKHQQKIEVLEQEEVAILEKQAELKKILYARFGKSIQLEE